MKKEVLVGGAATGVRSRFAGLKKNSLIYVVGGAIATGGNLFLTPLYTRQLNPAEFGVLNSVAIISTFLSAILGFGMASAVARYYFELEGANPTGWRKFLGTVSIFSVASACFLATLTVFLGEEVFKSLFPKLQFDPFVQIGVVLGFLGALPLIPLAILQAKGAAMKYRAMTMLSFLLVASFMVLFLVALQEGVLGALKAQLAAGVLMGLFYLAFLVREASPSVSMSYLSDALRFGLPVMLYTVLGMSSELLSRYLVQYFSGMAALGVFSVALMYASILGLVASAINMAWVPIFYRSAESMRTDNSYAKFALHYIAAMTSLGFILSMFSSELMSVFAASTYQSAHEIAPILILVNLLSVAIWTITANPIFFAKKTRVLPIMTSVSVAVSASLGLFLIPTWGLMGASIALFSANLVLVSLSFFFAQKIYPVAYEYGKIGFVLALAIGLSIVGYASNPFFSDSILGMKIGLCVAFVLILLLSRIFSISNLLSLRKFA